MKIAYILYDFHIGGMETAVYNIASRLRDDFECHFIATHVETISRKYRDIGYPVFLGQDWPRLIRYLREQRIDIVQYGNHRIFGDCALAAGIPIVIERTDGVRNGAALYSKRDLDGVIASTKGTVPLISQLIDPSKVHLIFNGIGTDQFDHIDQNRLGLAQDDIIIGRVSRFGPGKNLHLLVDAVRVLVERHPNVRLVLVGGNSRMPFAADYEKALRQRAAGLEDHVLFPGYVEEPEPIIKGFGIGTCVSRPGNEGIPNSLLECMAAGKPVVATDVDDIAEIVVDGKTGFLIEDNNLEQLVRALETLIRDPGLRWQMGQAGRFMVQRDFNLDTQARKYGALYASLLESRLPPIRLRMRSVKYRLKLRAGAYVQYVRWLQKAVS
ncbi:MAG: glycosyltransferase family 4 protein [Dehalococcoidia bacterium]